MKNIAISFSLHLAGKSINVCVCVYTHQLCLPTHLVVRHTMGTVWVERQRKAVLFCRDTEESQKCQEREEERITPE